MSTGWTRGVCSCYVHKRRRTSEARFSAAAVFSRDSGPWTAEFLVGDAELVLPEVGIAISLRDLYEGALSESDTSRV